MVNHLKTVALFLAVAFTGTAQAGILYDNGDADHAAINAIPISDGTSWGEDDFSFDYSVTITDVHFTVYTDDQGFSDLSLYGVAFGIYPELPGGAPNYASPLVSDYMAGSELTVTSTGFSAGIGFDEYNVEFDLHVPVVALKDTNYWLTLQTYSTGGGVFWAATNGLAGNAFYHPAGDAGTFTPALQEASFKISGVPVPATALLLLLGIAGLSASKRSKKQG